MSDTQSSKETMNQFVALSSLLTGFPTSTLAPRLDPINLKQTYLDTVNKNAPPSTVARLLKTFNTIQTSLPPEEWGLAVNCRILEDDVLGPLARQIIKMWLVGIWYDPPDQSQTGEVVSMQAFTHGLLWQAIQAHPTGYSEFAHGYWGAPPPPGPVSMET